MVEEKLPTPVYKPVQWPFPTRRPPVPMTEDELEADKKKELESLGTPPF